MKPWGAEPKPQGMNMKLWEAALIMPSLIRAKNDVAVELSGDVFAGSDSGADGLFGQFHDNSFIRAGLKYLLIRLNITQ